MSWASSQVRAYFDTKWDGIPASEAFDQAKAAAIRVMQHQIGQIESLDFETFARDQCAPGVTAETVRKS